MRCALRRAAFSCQRRCAWKSGAGSGNRTRIFSLEGCCSTTELYPRLTLKYRIHPKSAMHFRSETFSFQGFRAGSGGEGWIRTNVG